MVRPRTIDNAHRHARCPLCADAAVGPVGVIPLPAVVPFSTHAIALARPPELWRCGACGSAFVQHAVPPDVARELYATGDSGARWAQRRGFARTKTPDVLAALAPLVVAGGARVLDVGCNTGELLDWARAAGARGTAGVEYAAAARATCASRGHAAHASLDEATGPYDLVTAFDVVEHLYDVPGFLGQCRARLAPGGRLVVVTGNPDCGAAREDAARWTYVAPPEHVVFPSPAWWRRAPGFALSALRETWVDRGRAPSAPRRALASLARALRAPATPRDALRRGWRRGGADHVIVTLVRT